MAVKNKAKIALIAILIKSKYYALMQWIYKFNQTFGKSLKTQRPEGLSLVLSIKKEGNSK
jgi:hypothetical protein